MWADDMVAVTQAGFEPLADPERAAGARAYMKDVAPFLGLGTSDRRGAQRQAWRTLPPPDEGELLAGAAGLWELAEREYHYAAIELVGQHLELVGAERMDDQLRAFVDTRSWWDTVDLAGSRIVTPMVRRTPTLVAVMWDWNGSDDQWLVRASIQHQRGLKGDTDVPLLLAMCEPHAADRRFFVAKAIGWALRDLTAFDPEPVRAFLARHPDLPAVARREADRGLARAAG